MPPMPGGAYRFPVSMWLSSMGSSRCLANSARTTAISGHAAAWMKTSIDGNRSTSVSSRSTNCPGRVTVLDTVAGELRGHRARRFGKTIARVSSSSSQLDAPASSRTPSGCISAICRLDQPSCTIQERLPAPPPTMRPRARSFTSFTSRGHCGAAASGKATDIRTSTGSTSAPYMHPTRADATEGKLGVLP